MEHQTYATTPKCETPEKWVKFHKGSRTRLLCKHDSSGNHLKNFKFYLQYLLVEYFK